MLLPAVFAACDDDASDLTGPNRIVNSVVLDLSTDIGIMIVLFMNEQVEAAFYNAAIASSAFSGMTAEQREVIGDIRAVENIYREFFRTLLGGNGIGGVALNQTNIGTAAATAASILRTSEMLEDNGVATQNGVGKYIQSADNLAVAGELVSVEARHVAGARPPRSGRHHGRHAAGHALRRRRHRRPARRVRGTRCEGRAVRRTRTAAGDRLHLGHGHDRNRPATKSSTPDFRPPSPTP